ncbi:hypothetical protein CCR75_004148 [Bremia lactucae]|uniref:Nuclear pore complex protein Nup85 n=1 Tax=Bremia lactucae TaxID=4779 RepID=A0A976FHW6_BRELC|nr:hypothetical protein CCR75_004148 [Bremia lactucae]
MVSAWEILRSTQQLPLAEKELVFGKQLTQAAAAKSTAGAAWGKSARKWVAASDPPVREFGDAMPHELRTLVAASFDIFVSIQQTVQHSALNVARASREYREALKTCIFALEDRLESMTNDFASSEDESEFLDLLKVSLAIWHLCELLFLRKGARGADRMLAYELARWLQEHYCSTVIEKTEKESERLKKLLTPEDDPVFYRTIQSFVMAGNGASAWSLLASHSSYKSLELRHAMSSTGTSTLTAFHALQKLLLTMPGRADTSWNSADRAEWSHWHTACQYLLYNDSFIKTNAGLKTLVEILSANENVLNQCAETWYELMMARLFLDEPKTIAHRFEFLMANCFRVKHSNETIQMGNFECIVLAILQYDIQSALQDIIALGFSWMAAHLADLLQRNHVIVPLEIMPEGDCTLYERFVLQYAMDIGASCGMWQVAVRYYECCPQYGAQAIRSTLAREPLETDFKTERLLEYCHGKAFLARTQREIMRHRAEECHGKKMYAAAISWLLRGHHFDEIDALCDVLLKECDDRHALTPLHEAVQFLETRSDLVHPRKLAWVVKYRELVLIQDDLESLRQVLEKDASLDDQEKHQADCKQLRFVALEAAKRLDWLLRSNDAPKVLRSQILQQTERLLKESPTVFESRHLYSLLTYLQQLDRAFDRHEFYQVSANQHLKERVESLIGRNLAEAMLQEATASGCGLKLQNGQGKVAGTQPFLIADASMAS